MANSSGYNNDQRGTAANRFAESERDCSIEFCQLGAEQQITRLNIGHANEV